MGSGSEEKLRFCIDRGGTFTNVYAEIPGHLDGRILRLLSVDPSYYDDAPIEGIRRILEEYTGEKIPRTVKIPNDKIDWILMGTCYGILLLSLAAPFLHNRTTVATNALLERKEERIALCVTRGFKDLLQIGDQSRPHIFDLTATKPSNLYEEVIEVDERIELVLEEDKGNKENSESFVKGVSGEVVFGFDSHDVSRYAGSYEQVLETKIAGAIIQAPQLDINTVAAGGGSKLKFQFGAFRVGPESVGAHPGPMCYRKGGELAVTNANLILGKSQDSSAKDMTVEEIALGFVNVANETMCRPIQKLTEMKGHETRNHALACFGGAGPQHACAIARSLGMTEVLIHRFCGILSAYGMGLADVVEEAQEPYAAVYGPESVLEASGREAILLKQVEQKLQKKGIREENIKTKTYLNLRYEGKDTAIMVKRRIAEDGSGCDYADEFVKLSSRRVANILKPQALEPASGSPKIEGHYKVFFGNGLHDTPLFKLENLGYGNVMPGPAIIMNGISTVIVEPKCKAIIYGNSWTDVTNTAADFYLNKYQGKARLLLCSLCPDRGLVANAPLVPVHLGAMSSTVRWQLEYWGDNLNEGDVLVTNHPCAGGSHLPDITVTTPVFDNRKLVFFVASRGHHAEIRSVTPGSMPPFSKSIWEEGAAIKAFKLVEKGIFQEEGIIKLLKFPGADESAQRIPGTHWLQDNLSDLRAQVAANQRGITLIKELIGQYGLETVQAYMTYVQLNAEEAVREMLKAVAARVSSESTRLGERNFIMIEEEDCMDDESVIHLKLTIDSNKGEANFDFSGTSPEVYGNWNAPEAVTAAAIIYCIRCLVDVDIPLNQGCLAPAKIHVRAGSPSDKAAVVGGNVLTSQRITDVVLTAFQVCACSQGCMNNLTFGDNTFGYYETIGGGSGAGPSWNETS
ncbi:hypothetical protein CRYUN_Cryun06bG0080900 [Craigia yunnanensis]